MFKFPRTTFVDDNGIGGQVLHIGTELEEYEVELLAEHLPAALIELLDLRHSCETALRILREKYGVCTVDDDYRVIATYIPLTQHLSVLRYRYHRLLVSARHDPPLIIMAWILYLMQEIDAALVVLSNGTIGLNMAVQQVISKNRVRGYYRGRE